MKTIIRERTHIELHLKISGMFLLLLLFTACAKTGSFQTSTPIDTGSSSSSAGSSPGSSPGSSTPPDPGNGSQSYTPQALIWESSQHPERTQWSTGLMSIIDPYFSQLDKATDIAKFCPSYSQLSRDQKINLWADLFAATSYFESAYNPASYSVDVGSRNNSDTWSVGLLQMSVIDQESYNLPFGYDFTDLQDPLKNLHLAVAIMAYQIQKYGLVLIPTGHSGLYWATLHPGGQYDESANIIADTKKLSFCK